MMETKGNFYEVTILLALSTIPMSFQLWNHFLYLLRKQEEIEKVRYETYRNHITCFGNKLHLLFFE